MNAGIGLRTRGYVAVIRFVDTTAVLFKVHIAYEMLKQWPSAPLPAYLPDLRVITELYLRGDEMRTYAHRVIVYVGSRACTAHISAEGEDAQIQQLKIHISTCTLICTHDTHVHTHTNKHAHIYTYI